MKEVKRIRKTELKYQRNSGLWASGFMFTFGCAPTLVSDSSLKCVNPDYNFHSRESLKTRNLHVQDILLVHNLMYMQCRTTKTLSLLMWM